MATIHKRILTLVGVASIVLAATGILYNAATITTDYMPVFGEAAKGPIVESVDPENFYPLFYMLSGVCVAFYIVLAAAGVQLIRAKANWAFVLLGVVLAEVAYFVALIVIWPLFGQTQSVTAAWGLASGGLVIQGAVLFPLWGPVVAILTRRQMVKSTKTG